MIKYSYKAVNNFGQYQKGILSAQNPSDLASILKSNGYDLLSFQVKKSLINLSAFDRITTKDLISIFVHLEQLERAGVSILDSISDIKETSDSAKIRDLMGDVLEAIKNGSLFSESLSKHPKVFNQIYIGLIAAGERTGNLATSFQSIIEDLKWNMEMKRKARKATVGPVFGILMMFVVVGVMTTVVIPKVTGFLKMQDIGLPLSTRALIAFSDFFTNNWYIIVFFFPALFLILKLLKLSEKFVLKYDHFKLKIPIFGPVMNKIDAAKFCQFFSMTFKSGLGVLECLDAASSVIKNKAMKRSIFIVKQQVSEGASLAKSINSTGFFPNLVVRMFKIGEDSGNMENALLNIKFFYDREINDSIDRLIGMIQPTLTMIMGGMIGWIAIAVFGPVYNSFSKLK